MSDTFVTFHGWVGGEVTHRTPGGVSVVNFRVASTPRIKRKSDWMDGETTWYWVNAWRGLADNVRDSVRKGDAVVVHGRLRTEAWERDSRAGASLVVEATFVGHDLTRGTSTFVKKARPERQDVDPHEEVHQMIAGQAEDPPAMDSWGNARPDTRREAEPAAADPAVVGAQVSDPGADRFRSGGLSGEHDAA